ncbi:ribonuclease H-like domain-containing protein [Tanacetum coccineum]
MGLNRPLGPDFSDLQPMLLGLVFSTVDKYATEVLERAGMLTCNPCRTPVDTDSKLAAAGDPVSDPTLYRRLAGALQYLTFTRPDISYAVQQVCLFMHDPREPHFSALKRILRYVRGTLTSGLQLYSSTTSSLVAYSDADWAGCPTTRRSTSGYCVFLGNNLLSWSSKRQFTLSRSSAEAEYRGVANAVAETCWLRNLLRELHTPLSTATIVYCDNVSVVYLSSNPVQHQRTKHIEIDIHFVRDLVTTGHIRVLHVPSRYQYADIFTKGLPTALFDEFRDSLSVRSSPAQTAGGLDVVFDGAFEGVGDEEVVVGEGVVVISSSLDMLTNSFLGGIMVSLIFFEGLDEEAFVEFMVE